MGSLMTKGGVKGVVDDGITKVPRIFIHPPEHLDRITASENTEFSFPVIDLDGVEKDPVRHQKIVEEIRDAAESWGFFQVVNHGILVSDMQEMINGVRRFYEQDNEVKKQYYRRDATKRVVHNSNYDLYTGPAADWRDSFYCLVAPDLPVPEELPSVCRLENDNLGIFGSLIPQNNDRLFKEINGIGMLFAQIIGRKPRAQFQPPLRYDCAEGIAMLCHYYPACPEPEVTIGASKHSDNTFLTVLLQDNLGGLQVFHQGHWVDVSPRPGALVVNIGDFVQIMSNDKFKSIEQRVLGNRAGPRISVACFFTTGPRPNSKLYGPIDELLSDENPPKYRSFTMKEYTDYYRNRGPDDISSLLHFKL